MTEVVKIGVLLAAGLGKRMQSKRHKVVHEVCGKPMILHIVEAMQAVGFDRLLVVVGSKEEQVREVLGDRVSYVRQSEQLGTGHAVMQVAEQLPADGVAVVLYGDGPLIRQEEIERLLHTVERDGVNALLTAHVEDPYGLGRIVRDEAGDVLRIIEEKDATEAQRTIREVNSGLFAFSCKQLLPALAKLTRDNAQGEYLLTDCVEHIRAAGGTVRPIVLQDADDIAMVNDRAQLAVAEDKLKRRILHRHMMNGVTVIDPASTYVDADVVIGRDTVLWPGTFLQGQTIVGEDCQIGPHARLRNTAVGDRVTIESSVLSDCTVANGASVGPFAYVRPGSAIGEDVKIGDFVEVKNAIIGQGTKISHLAYVGDSDVGKNVNVGCGVVTVNYDGYRKHRSTIGDDSFIGSNVNLIAPVRVARGGYVATGSTITDDVGENDFAIARERQTTKPGYAPKLRARLQQKGGH
ncbi:MAG: bifunctional UDP-N-acetylglucosamine diphosphorylase/glucosamine-1-phosphate N-acetyltransferase GlmU [Firmicutes bacterium]|nr:bifunctional UDP-N-acetylglucosamine diphosphorylase/glucosamine-1-phosphate N-acetyltransferase GlmU [Bacillota bacterium]